LTGGFTLVPGLDIPKLTKTPLIYAVVFIFQFRGHWMFVWGAKPKRYPVATGVVEGFIFRFRVLSLGFGV